MKTDKHQQLQETAIRWLYERNCSAFAQEVPTWNGVADALGIITSGRAYSKEDIVYYIEAKASRSDLLSFKQRQVYQRTQELHSQAQVKELKMYFGQQKDFSYKNNIDFFYFIVADGVNIEEGLYPLWGVINEQGKVIRKATRMKKEKDIFENSNHDLMLQIAHVLVYKVFGKMYLS